MSVARAQKEINSIEFNQWAAFFQIEPPTGFRVDYGFAQLATLLVNIHRDPKKARPYLLKDFMPRYGEQRVRRQSTEDMVVALTAWKNIHNRAQSNAASRAAKSKPAKNAKKG